jgi:hypothetical protein
VRRLATHLQRPDQPNLQEKRVANDRACTRVTVRNLHGKEGVDGSSPSEGSAKARSAGFSILIDLLNGERAVSMEPFMELSSSNDQGNQWQGRPAAVVFYSFSPRLVIALTPVLCRACWSLLHPWIVRRVGVHRRATVIDGFGAQFVVPGFVAVDLA